MSPYNISLLTIRLIAIISLVVGVSWFLAGVVLAWLIVQEPTLKNMLDTAMGLWLNYAVLDIIAGAILFVFAAPLARLAAEPFGSKHR